MEFNSRYIKSIRIKSIRAINLFIFERETRAGKYHHVVYCRIQPLEKQLEIRIERSRIELFSKKDIINNRLW